MGEGNVFFEVASSLKKSPVRYRARLWLRHFWRHRVCARLGRNSEAPF